MLLLHLETESVSDCKCNSILKISNVPLFDEFCLLKTSKHLNPVTFKINSRKNLLKLALTLMGLH